MNNTSLFLSEFLDYVGAKKTFIFEINKSFINYQWRNFKVDEYVQFDCTIHEDSIDLQINVYTSSFQKDVLVQTNIFHPQTFNELLLKIQETLDELEYDSPGNIEYLIDID